MFKFGVISGPYFPVLSANTGKYGPEITPYLDTFHAAIVQHNELQIVQPIIVELVSVNQKRYLFL